MKESPPPPTLVNPSESKRANVSSYIRTDMVVMKRRAEVCSLDDNCQLDYQIVLQIIIIWSRGVQNDPQKIEMIKIMLMSIPLDKSYFYSLREILIYFTFVKCDKY